MVNIKFENYYMYLVTNPQTVFIELRYESWSEPFHL